MAIWPNDQGQVNPGTKTNLRRFSLLFYKYSPFYVPKCVKISMTMANPPAGNKGHGHCHGPVTKRHEGALPRGNDLVGLSKLQAKKNILGTGLGDRHCRVYSMSSKHPSHVFGPPIKRHQLQKWGCCKLSQTLGLCGTSMYQDGTNCGTNLQSCKWLAWITYFRSRRQLGCLLSRAPTFSKSISLLVGQQNCLNYYFCVCEQKPWFYNLHW